MSIAQDAQNKADVEELDRMTGEVASGIVSDAVRVGYLSKAQTILRRLYKNGVNYEGTGDFITLARAKAHIPDPQPAVEEGVEAGHTPSEPASEGADTPKPKPRSRAKASPAKGAGSQESAS